MQDEGGSPSPVRGCLCSCDPLASSLVLAQWWACPGLGGQSRLSWVSPVGAGSLWAATLGAGEGRAGGGLGQDEPVRMAPRGIG